MAHTAIIDQLSEKLGTGGMRFTRQRQHVYSVLLRKQDHPTAEEIFIRSKREMPDISLATVYNCLDALVKCGMARQVTVDRGAARFCPNMRDHSHFFCERCHGVFDVEVGAERQWSLPDGFRARRFDVAIHGLCPGCGDK